MTQLVLHLISLLICLSESLDVSWLMAVESQVESSEGQSVVLPCVFTHPQQKTYHGIITVQWILDAFAEKAFFNCSVWNTTDPKPNNCFYPRQQGRFSLRGDPRERDVSLRITDLRLTDSRMYFCRVELEYNKYQERKGTTLKVTGPARILSLSPVSGPSSRGGELECVAEGSPLPVVTWHSSSRGMLRSGMTQTENHTLHRIHSTLASINSEDVYTCKAMNALGSAHREFSPGANPLTVGLSVGGASLLLLGLGVMLALLWSRGKLCNSFIQTPTQSWPVELLVQMITPNKELTVVCLMFTRQIRPQEIQKLVRGRQTKSTCNTPHVCGSIETETVYSTIDHSASAKCGDKISPAKVENETTYAVVAYS